MVAGARCVKKKGFRQCIPVSCLNSECSSKTDLWETRKAGYKAGTELGTKDVLFPPFGLEIALSWTSSYNESQGHCLYSHPNASRGEASEAW